MATRKTAITERTRLEEELRTLGRSRGSAEREAKAAKAEAEQLTASYRADLKLAVRDDEKARKRADEARPRIEAKQAEAAAASDRAEAAEAARRETERELARHLYDRLDDFIAEATKLSDAAVKSRGSAVDALAEAQAAEGVARKEWVKLRSATRKQQESEDLPSANSASGTWRRRFNPDLGQLPPAAIDAEMVTRLGSAPAPKPLYLRDATRARRAGAVVPAAVRKLLGISEKPVAAAEKPDSERLIVEVE